MAFGNATKGYVKAHSGGGGSSGTTNYNNLNNKPSINGVELSGNKTSSDLGIVSGGLSFTDVTTEVTTDGISVDDYNGVLVSYKDTANPSQIATSIFPINENMSGNLVVNINNGYLALIATISDGMYKLEVASGTQSQPIYKVYAF